MPLLEAMSERNSVGRRRSTAKQLQGPIVKLSGASGMRVYPSGVFTHHLTVQLEVNR